MGGVYVFLRNKNIIRTTPTPTPPAKTFAKWGGTMTIAVKTSPRLWKASVARACTEAGLCAHSARKMQWAARDYKARGGGYADDGAGNSLRKWTAERWRTHTGAPSAGTLRYLPDAVWSQLTPSQVRRTNAAKRRGTRRGRQYVPNPSDVRRVAARSRRRQSRARPSRQYHIA